LPKTLNGVSAKTERESGSSDRSVLRLATTTSTRDSGLLDVLLPVFEEASACRVDVIAVGTGAALKLGESGDVDAALVHARSAEKVFMNAGHGIRHEPVMHNYFLIAGPADDPAGARGRDTVAALKTIAAGKHRFVSRGDDSGTHKRERSLWKTAGGQPEWEGYVESGQGMGPTLVMADEMNAYVLTDEGTWLKQSGKFRLVPLVTEAADLRNPYSVMVVNQNKHPSVNSNLAGALVDFLISAQGQQLIAEYRINGQGLFHADRLEKEPPE
jgi:tungstate transport system substrate-binding protein